MDTATVRIQVGVRDLRYRLSHYLERVRNGDEVIVTLRGAPVARLTAIDDPTDRLTHLIAAGRVRPAAQTTRSRPTRRITPTRPVSDLLAEQRR